MDMDYRAVRTNRFKLIHWMQHPDDAELYDLQQDPLETTNLIADPALAEVLFREGPRVAQWVEETCGVQWQLIDDFADYHYPKAPGTVATGRYLEPALFEGATLGPWQKKSYTTPHMPPGISHEELFAWGGLPRIMEWDFATMGQRIAKDIRGMGPAMMGWFLKAAVVDRGIEARVGTAVTRLIREEGRVVGVEVSGESGREVKSPNDQSWSRQLSRSASREDRRDPEGGRRLRDACRPGSLTQTVICSWRFCPLAAPPSFPRPPSAIESRAGRLSDRHAFERRRRAG